MRKFALQIILFVLGIIFAAAFLWWLAGQADEGFFYLDLPPADATETLQPILYITDSIGRKIPTDCPRLTYPGMTSQTIEKLVLMAPYVSCRRVVLVTGTNDLRTGYPPDKVMRDLRSLANICMFKFQAPVYVVSPWDVRHIARLHSADGIHPNAFGHKVLLTLYPCLVDEATL